MSQNRTTFLWIVYRNFWYNICEHVVYRTFFYSKCGKKVCNFFISISLHMAPHMILRQVDNYKFITSCVFCIHFCKSKQFWEQFYASTKAIVKPPEESTKYDISTYWEAILFYTKLQTVNTVSTYQVTSAQLVCSSVYILAHLHLWYKLWSKRWHSLFSALLAQTQCLPCPPLFHGRTGWTESFFAGFGHWYSCKPQAKNSFLGIYCLE